MFGRPSRVMWPWLAVLLCALGCDALETYQYVESHLLTSVPPQQDTLVDVAATSTLNCARLCSRVPCCVTFTFTHVTSACRGYSVNKTSDWAAATKGGDESFFLLKRFQIIERPAACHPLQELCQQDDVYQLYPPVSDSINATNDNVTAYCEGGWTIFQRRTTGLLDFYRNWASYADGFGDPYGEYWLGLEAVHRLTGSGLHELQVDVEDWTGSWYSASYSAFSLGSAIDNYTLHFDAFTGGDAGDSLTYHKGMQFSTLDADNDLHSANCAAGGSKGSWWYRSCFTSNLNGRYFGATLPTNTTYTNSWKALKNTNYYSLKSSKMKTRPVS